MLPNTRLGKRSPLGALLSSSCSTCPLGGSSACSTCHPAAGDPDTSSRSRSVSSTIDVPRSGRSLPETDMDELMAAMILSSLSCSQLLHSPAHQVSTGSLVDGGSGELSDGGSSGYWSIGHVHLSPNLSPPITEADAGPVMPPDEGLNMELDQVLFDEPAPRKRKNSLKVMFRCLWPGCEKVLTSTVGIKRHIRTTHLSHGSEHELCSSSEEDFYYTEISQWECPQLQTPPTLVYSDPAPVLPSSPPPSSPPALSCSAPSPGSCWQVQSEHSYQALPPSHVMSMTVLTTPPNPSVALPTSCTRQGLSFRVRSVSVGEQWLQHHSTSCRSVSQCLTASQSQYPLVEDGSHTPFSVFRRIRGEAKKCRKVYGIEHRELWCTACRWKKACQRFLD